MKINTKLHNLLIEESTKQNNILAQTNTMVLKRDLLKQRLINYSMIVLFIFVLLLIFILLFKFVFDSGYIAKNQDTTKTTIVKKDQNSNKKADIPFQNNAEQFEKSTSSNNKKKHLINGIDYVKKDNFIYKRVWKGGVVVKEKKLKQTIEDSRKYEKIPQFSKENN